MGELQPISKDATDHIFEYLRVAEIYSALNVCRYWNAIANSLITREITLDQRAIANSES